MVVVDLAARRSDKWGEGPGRCGCGSEWFTLHGRPNDPPVAEHGAVTVDETGDVTGYCGSLRCAECHTPWTPRGVLV